jgi:hypothetical protein
MATRPSSFIREKPGIYWVLAEYPSKSSPGKMYEVRTSQRDGKTYCTCRGWVAALNKNRWTKTKGPACCCHINAYKKNKPEEPLVIMDFEDFVAVKRGITIITNASVGSDVKVRRA